MKGGGRRKGVTLIEMALALGILAILIIPLSNGIAAIINMNKKNEQNLKVASLMEKAVEIARAQNFQNLNDISMDGYTAQYSAETINETALSGIDNESCDIKIYPKYYSSDLYITAESISPVPEIIVEKKLEDNDMIKIEARRLGNSTTYKITMGTLSGSYTADNSSGGILIDGKDKNIPYAIITDNLSSDGLTVKHINKGQEKVSSNNYNVFVIDNDSANSETENENIIKLNIVIKDNEERVIKNQTYYFKQEMVSNDS